MSTVSVPVSPQRHHHTASVVVVDPNDHADAALTSARALTLHTCDDPLQAVALIGLHNIDVAIVHADIGAEQMNRFTRVVHGELGLPVLIAYTTRHLDDLGPAVLAGARPAIDLPYTGKQVYEAVHSVAPAPTPSTLAVADLVVDPHAYSARLADKPITLSALEFRILFEFVNAPDEVLARSYLAERFWPDTLCPEGAVAAAVKRLRRRLEIHGIVDAISNVRGVGYRLDSAALRILG